MIAFATPLSVFTLGVMGHDAHGRFYVSYEVIAPDEREAARLAFADMALRGETPDDVDYAEASPVASPVAAPGVRFRTGRAAFGPDEP